MTAQVAVKGGPVGFDKVELDGADITNKVRGFSITGAPGEVMEIRMTLAPETDIKVEGETFLDNAQSQRDMMLAFAEWLKTRDAGEVERIALSMMGMNESGPFAEKILQVLAEMVEVAANGSPR